MRLLAFTACMVMCFALSANADTINIMDTSTGSILGALEYTRDTTYSADTGYDTIAINLGSFVSSSMTGVNGLTGTWSAVGTDKYLAVGQATYTYKKVGTKYSWIKTDNWVASTLGDAGTPAGDTTSSMGFTAATGGTLNTTNGNTYNNYGGLLFGRDGTWDSTNQIWDGVDSTYLTGTWYSTANLALGDMLATIYVTAGGDVSFTGQLGTNVGVSNVSFSTVPEPSTIAMLAGALLGLVAYAWRKRRK